MHEEYEGTTLAIDKQFVPAADHVDPDYVTAFGDGLTAVLSSHPSAPVIITRVRLGVYRFSFSGLDPALVVGDDPEVAIDRAIDGTTFTTWSERVRIVQRPPTVAENQAGISTHAAGDVVSGLQNVANEFKATGFATPANVTAVESKVDTLLGRITATLFAGLTSLPNWLRMIVRKDYTNAGTTTEIGGTYSAATDSLEAQKDAAAAVGDVTVASFTAAALLQLVTDDTGQAMAADGSVARIAQGSAADNTDELQTIIEQTSLISGARIEVVSPVSKGGTVTIYRGSDYRVRNNTAIAIAVDDAGGTLHAIFTDSAQVESIIFGAGQRNAANCVVGTIAADDLAYADNVLTILVEITADQINAAAGTLDYHIKAVSPVADGESRGDEAVRIDGSCEVRNERATP